MMKKQNFSRKERIAAKVQSIVAEILQTGFMDDPVLAGVSLTGAESAGGPNYVKLFYNTRQEMKDKRQVQKRLDDVSQMIRYELAQRMNQKYVPEIRFAYDDTLERAQRIDELLKNINQK